MGLLDWNSRSQELLAEMRYNNNNLAMVAIPAAVLLTLLEGIGGSVSFELEELYKRSEVAMTRLMIQQFRRDVDMADLVTLRIREEPACGVREAHISHQFYRTPNLTHLWDPKNDEKVLPTPTAEYCEGWT